MCQKRKRKKNVIYFYVSVQSKNNCCEENDISIFTSLTLPEQRQKITFKLMNGLSKISVDKVQICVNV